MYTVFDLWWFDCKKYDIFKDEILAKEFFDNFIIEKVQTLNLVGYFSSIKKNIQDSKILPSVFLQFNKNLDKGFFDEKLNNLRLKSLTPDFYKIFDIDIDDSLENFLYKKDDFDIDEIYTSYPVVSVEDGIQFIKNIFSDNKIVLAFFKTFIKESEDTKKFFIEIIKEKLDTFNMYANSAVSNSGKFLMYYFLLEFYRLIEVDLNNTFYYDMMKEKLESYSNNDNFSKIQENLNYLIEYFKFLQNFEYLSWGRFLDLLDGEYFKFENQYVFPSAYYELFESKFTNKLTPLKEFFKIINMQ